MRIDPLFALAAVAVALPVRPQGPPSRAGGSHTAIAETAVVEKRDVVDRTVLEGVFVPGDAAEITPWPLEFSGELILVEVLPHGSPVNEGDVVARLDDRSYREQLEEAERALASAELAQRIARERDALAAAEAERRLEAKRKEVEWAGREFSGWFDVERELDERSRDLEEQRIEFGIQDQRDELEQLELMYGEDELVDATEEIVLRRARRDLAASEASLRLHRERRAYRREVPEAVELERRREALRTLELELERLERSTALDREAARDELARGEARLERQRREVERLREDAKWFELRAPRAGILLHGGREDYGPGRTRPEHRRGGRLAPRETAFLVADPDRPVAAVEIPEEEWERIPDGVGGIVQAFGGGVPAVAARLDVSRLPIPGKPSALLGRAKLSEARPGLRIGARARFEVVREEIPDALLVPRSAIMGKRDSPIVWVQLEDSVQFVPVVLGPVIGKKIVLREGPAPGTRVLLGADE